MLEHLVERGVALDGLTFAEARRRYQELPAADEAADGVVDAGGFWDTSLPDDLDDLVLGTVLPG